MKIQIIICVSWALGAIYSLMYADTDSEAKKVGLMFIGVAVLTGLQWVAMQ